MLNISLEKDQQIDNRENDSQPLGAITCMQPASRNLQIVNKKVLLSAQPSANSVLPNNREYTATVAGNLVCICWKLTKCKGMPEIAYKYKINRLFSKIVKLNANINV